MLIGERLRALREQKSFSQGEIQKRAGFHPGYLSCLENGYKVPTVNTMEKLARALDVPLYQLLYEVEMPPRKSSPSKFNPAPDTAWGSRGNDARMLAKFRKLFNSMNEDDRKLVFFLLQKMVGREHTVSSNRRSDSHGSQVAPLP